MKLTRRLAMKVVAFASALLGGRRGMAQNTTGDTIVGHWNKTHNRVWLGGEFWANPMEDWKIVDGAAECQKGGGDRNIHLITHDLSDPNGALDMSVVISRVDDDDRPDKGAGFRIGVHSEINEYRSNAFAKGGIDAGLIDGTLVLGKKQQATAANLADQDVVLKLTGKPAAGGQYELTLTAEDTSGKSLGTVTSQVGRAAITGNIALVNNYQVDGRQRESVGARHRFRDWAVSGSAFRVYPDRKFGPILWSMYTLSDSRSDEGFVLKISALTGPLGEDDDGLVELLVKRGSEWSSLGNAELDRDAWTATFRVPNWNEKEHTPYKLVYREKLIDGSTSESVWTGNIKPNPSGRPLRLGALTCQNHYGFPYEPVVNNVIKLDPDMLYFSGDQLYESHGGYGVIRDPADMAILNYLRKFYMFGWAFRDALRDRPTVCIPDDHDVFHGNIWGEGGAKMIPGSAGTSSHGGYRQPARMVNAVHKTNAGHHPEPYDPTPVKQGISVYYGDLVYGNVSFAILGDRQFKSSPKHVDTGGGRPDHVPDPNFDTSVLDKPGLILLGDRQETFLKRWGRDWRGHELKVLLSQTVFAGVATHHGGKNGYLKADLDSGGWPQTARNNAIDIIREAKCLHINGDQHLTTVCQYGVDSQRDSNWSFCTPAIAAGYPRWWRPDEIGMSHEKRPRHGHPNTGEFVDGFGNKVYVYAVGNPQVGKAKNRYERAHEKGSGFGLVTIDTRAKTYTMEAFRFLVDASVPNPANQFPGWPLTIHQDENAGENRVS